MTTKQRAIQVIEALAEDATIEEIIATLRHLDSRAAVEPSTGEANPGGSGVWDLLERSAGTVEMPEDWAAGHDHYLYGTPNRSPAA